MTRTPPDLSDLTPDEFELWFGLRTAAQEGQWQKMAERLDAMPAQAVLRHVLTTAALQNATLAGQDELVARMIAGGYVPEVEDLHEVFKAVAARLSDIPPAAADGIAQSVAHIAAATDFDQAAFATSLVRAAEAGTLLSLAHAAKIDIFQEGASLQTALAENRVAAFRGLCALGVSPYAPNIVRYMRKPLAEDAPRPARDLRDAWKTLCTQDNRDGLAILTRLMPKEDADYRAAMFLNPVHLDANGEPVTLLGVMAACGLAPRIFAEPARWAAHPAEAALVYKALAEYGVDEGITLGPLQSYLRQKKIGRTAGKKPGLRL